MPQGISTSDGFWTICFLFLLGVLVAVRSHRHRTKFGFGTLFDVMLFGAIFGVAGEILLTLQTGAPRNEAGGPDLISLLGLIVTVITGVTIVLAFRTLDEAKGAQEKVRESVDLIDERMAVTRLALLRLEAYLEAESRLRQAQEVSNRRQELLRVELAPIFIMGDCETVLARAKAFLSRPGIFEELGPAGRQFFEALETDGSLSRSGRKTLRKIMGYIS